MENQQMEIPDHPVMMQTNRNYRLSSLYGYVVNFKANEPTRVPPQCYEEAIRVGAVECEDQPEWNKPEEKEVRGAAEAAELDAQQKREHIQKACLKLMMRADNTDFKADGYPKLNKVVAELPPECPRPTAGEVQEVYDNLRDNVDLAETD